MKKLLLLSLTICCFYIANAQDRIYTTDGQVIEARNIKREGAAFRYSLYSASVMDRSTYMIDANRVVKIKYEDGRVYVEQPVSNNSSTQMQATAAKHEESTTKKRDNPDTMFVYATLSPNKQLTPKLYNAYPPYKSPALSFASSMILPGLGQMYNDEVSKGLVFLGVDIAAWALFFISINNDYLPYIFAAVGAGIHIAAPIEAAITSDNLNRGHGYLALYPSVSRMSYASADGVSTLVPSMVMSLSF